MIFFFFFGLRGMWGGEILTVEGEWKKSPTLLSPSINLISCKINFVHVSKGSNNKLLLPYTVCRNLQNKVRIFKTKGLCPSNLKPYLWSISFTPNIFGSKKQKTKTKIEKDWNLCNLFIQYFKYSSHLYHAVRMVCRSSFRTLQHTVNRENM